MLYPLSAAACGARTYNLEGTLPVAADRISPCWEIDVSCNYSLQGTVSRRSEGVRLDDACVSAFRGRRGYLSQSLLHSAVVGLQNSGQNFWVLHGVEHVRSVADGADHLAGPVRLAGVAMDEVVPHLACLGDRVVLPGREADTVGEGLVVHSRLYREHHHQPVDEGCDRMRLDHARMAAVGQTTGVIGCALIWPTAAMRAITSRCAK